MNSPEERMRRMYEVAGHPLEPAVLLRLALLQARDDLLRRDEELERLRGTVPALESRHATDQARLADLEAKVAELEATVGRDSERRPFGRGATWKR